MILLIDNYDSFTYNLVQLLGTIDPSLEVVVRRNDEIDLQEVQQMAPDRLIVSPGPCTPDQAGVSVELIRRLADSIPVLGVCLGHQCIAAAFGGRVSRAKRIMHGKTSPIHHDGRTIYRGLPNPFTATRYHSLDVAPEHVPDSFEVSATTEDQNEVMGIRHRKLPVEGVQFHPESFLTEAGERLVRNFLVHSPPDNRE